MVSEPAQLGFIIPNDVPEDIKLMSIWVQVYQAYAGDLTPDQLRAAITWFKSYLESEIDS